jgi:DNA polymerase-1
MAAPRLVLIDGYSLLFRAYYGSRPLTTADGRPTGALFTFLNMLLNVLKEEKPTSIIVALDAPGKTVRHDDFEAYKGTRRETPDDLISQLDASRELLSRLSIPAIELAGYEADDIIGTLSRMAGERGWEAVIYSGDQDAVQLVDEKTVLVMPPAGKTPARRLDPAGVRERYGFEPRQMIDYKALAGDSSDNIPGVPGIGEKSAKALIGQFGSIDALLERMSEAPAKFLKKLEPGRESMILSRKLATILRDAPIEFVDKAYRISSAQAAEAQKCLLDYEFRSLAERFSKALQPYLDGGGELGPLFADAGEAVEWKDAGRRTALGLEKFVGLEPYGLFLGSDGAFVARGRMVASASREDGLSLLARRPGQAVGHDLKAAFKAAGAEGAPRMDTLLAAFLLNSERGGAALGDLVAAFLDGPSASSPQECAAALVLLEPILSRRLAEEEQAEVLSRAELPLVPILADMEKAGIAVDRRMLEDFSKSLEIQIESSTARVHEMAGGPINIGSPKQLGELLFERMALPGGKKTKTGWATGAEILSELAAEHPIAAEILAWRELTKLKSTYADALPRMIRDDGRIHTTFNQTVAATGRLSSNEPNLQNIPIRTELGRQIRRAFVAPDGYELLSLDYSQIELRVLAHMCEDPALVQAFRTGQDVHAATAALMFDEDLGAVTKEQRRLAKLLNYAVLYGVTGYGLSNQLGPGFSPADANALIKQYSERFPTVKAFTDHLVMEARASGFTRTLIGRRRVFPDINAPNWSRRQYAERQAMNAPIQGTAADMIKLAMVDVAREVPADQARLLLQVHDELVFEIPAGERGAVEPVRRLMEQALPLQVPVEVDAKAGPNWLEMEAVPRTAP